MSRLVWLRPRHYPHWGNYAYTPRGFRQTQEPRLRREGFTERDIGRLRELYFTRYAEHQNATGDYVNRRCFRLYALTRQVVKGDRKQRLFDLVMRSGLFGVCCDCESGEVVAFRSPRAAATMGLVF